MVLRAPCSPMLFQDGPNTPCTMPGYYYTFLCILSILSRRYDLAPLLETRVDGGRPL